jgi:5-formyltetrahydrofolate cyclo-ligase
MNDFSNHQKTELRKYFKQLRSDFSQHERNQASIAVKNNLELLCAELCPKSLGLYYAINSEISVHDLRINEVELALPKITQDNQLQFLTWQNGDQIVQGEFGIMQPSNHNIIIPQAIITPLLAIDKSGGRLGYGGGYYDKYFAQYPNLLKIGVGFMAQFYEKLPNETHDIKMDYFISDAKEIIKF